MLFEFGLVNALASFTRLMWKLLQDTHSNNNFIDDVIIFTTTFQDHLLVVEEFLQRLRTANLTTKPSKCLIAFSSLECLWYIAGNEKLKPIPDKVKAIHNYSRPTTSKQVRSFLGLVGFYKKFIPNFSAVVSPLSDLTKNGLPNKVVWESPSRTPSLR